MRHVPWTIAFPLAALLLAGCGGSPDDALTNQLSPTSSETRAAGTGSSAPLTAGTEMPAGVVARFYDALKNGEDSTIAQLLTDKAHDETAENGLEILSQRNTSLSYAVGETEYVTEEMDGAHVASLWTETNRNGQSVTTEVIWVLRKQAVGWRIAGFAQVFENEVPVLFNFEDPEHMLRTKEYVETEFYGGQEEPPVQTAAPELPGSTDPRLR